ncbi:uncharacterized protein [Rutidosis leptorrhynchoides]|uniref:uncharacterized protein n=1 Tax=Rutidosis leptorrhynchoides TaxID=125765 RepID=UPI003A99702A
MNSVTNLRDQKKLNVTDSAGPSNCNNGDFRNSHPYIQADYLDTFPIGYRFKPTDEELVSHYLLPKIKNLVVPKSKIWDVNVYEKHPKDLAESYPEVKEGEWYFFTSRNRRGLTGTRPCRKAGPGYWKASTPVKDIKSNNDGKRIGGKMLLVYLEGKSGYGAKTDWHMHEYVIHGHTDMKFDDYVLCKITNKKYKKKRNVVNQQLNGSSNDPANGLVNQQAHAVPNQNMNGPTDFQIERNPNVQLSDLLSDTLRVGNNLLNRDFTQQLNQVRHNMIIQNLLRRLSQKIRYVPRTCYSNMGTPSVNHSIQSQLMNRQLLVNRYPHFPPPPNAQVQGFPVGNSFDQFEADRHVERML